MGHGYVASGDEGLVSKLLRKGDRVGVKNILILFRPDGQRDETWFIGYFAHYQTGSAVVKLQVVDLISWKEFI